CSVGTVVSSAAACGDPGSGQRLNILIEEMSGRNVAECWRRRRRTDLQFVVDAGGAERDGAGQITLIIHLNEICVGSIVDGRRRGEIRSKNITSRSRRNSRGCVRSEHRAASAWDRTDCDYPVQFPGCGVVASLELERGDRRSF